jgi:hypothetical protein
MDGSQGRCPLSAAPMSVCRIAQLRAARPGSRSRFAVLPAVLSPMRRVECCADRTQSTTEFGGVLLIPPRSAMQLNTPRGKANSMLPVTSDLLPRTQFAASLCCRLRQPRAVPTLGVSVYHKARGGASRCFGASGLLDGQDCYLWHRLVLACIPVGRGAVSGHASRVRAAQRL